MTAQISLTPIISIIAGVLILVFPGFLRFIVGLYLILIGALAIIKY